mmetsp:Transcript_13088/g.36822  ORF Transcript_13088/g.36822 Transcript_13088/m.36822 type:complete len:305 (+) Transcript_13088:32-946(+)
MSSYLLVLLLRLTVSREPYVLQHVSLSRNQGQHLLYQLLRCLGVLSNLHYHRIVLRRHVKVGVTGNNGSTPCIVPFLGLGNTLSKGLLQNYEVVEDTSDPGMQLFRIVIVVVVLVVPIRVPRRVQQFFNPECWFIVTARYHREFLRQELTLELPFVCGLVLLVPGKGGPFDYLQRLIVPLGVRGGEFGANAGSHFRLIIAKRYFGQPIEQSLQGIDVDAVVVGLDSPDPGPFRQLAVADARNALPRIIGPLGGCRCPQCAARGHTALHGGFPDDFPSRVVGVPLGLAPGGVFLVVADQRVWGVL